LAGALYFIWVKSCRWKKIEKTLSFLLLLLPRTVFGFLLKALSEWVKLRFISVDFCLICLRNSLRLLQKIL